MITISGTNRNLLINAMKFLHLIDEGGLPQPDLNSWVAAVVAVDKDAEKKMIKQILQGAYPTLFQAGFNLKGATPSEFSEKFKAMKLGLDTARKAETFFLEAAKDAGVEISPVIVAARKKGRKAGSTVAPRKSTASKQHNQHDNGDGDEAPTPPAQEFPAWYTTFKPAFDLLPKFSTTPRPKWTSGEKENFLNLVTALTTAYIELDDKKKV